MTTTPYDTVVSNGLNGLQDTLEAVITNNGAALLAVPLAFAAWQIVKRVVKGATR